LKSPEVSCSESGFIESIALSTNNSLTLHCPYILFLTERNENAGPDVTVCGNNPAVSINGAVTIATGGTWTGGTGIFVPDNNTLSNC